MTQFLETAWEAAKLWYMENGDYMAATMSYYALFSIVPLLLLTISIIGMLYGKEFVVTTLYDWGSVLGPDVLTLLTEAVGNLEVVSSTYGFSFVGIFFLSVMIILMFNTFTSGLHKLWGLSYQGLNGWVKKSLRSSIFLIVLEVYLLFLVGLGAMMSFLIEGTGLTIVKVIEPLFFIIATGVLFSLSYKILPWESPSTASRLYGAFVASIMFAIAKFFVVLYVNTTPVPGIFGAAGLVLVLLIWIYVTACILYYGAAFAHVLDRKKLDEREATTVSL